MVSGFCLFQDLTTEQFFHILSGNKSDIGNLTKIGSGRVIER